MKTIDDALNYADTYDAPHSKHMSIVMLAAEVRRLRDEVNGLTGSLERAEAWQEAVEDIASYMSVGIEGCDPAEAVARIKKASDDFVRVAVQRAERAEAALKEAQEQEPCAFWWIGPDGKDNGGPYRGKPSDVAIDNARNMGCEPVLLYARPVPAAPAVPSLYVAFTDNDEHIRFWTRSKNAADLFRINHPDWPVIEFFGSPLQTTGEEK